MSDEPTSIKGKQIDQAHKGKPKPKLKFADIYRNIADAINHDQISSLPHIPEQYVVTEPEPGVRTILEVGPEEVCRYVSPEAVIGAVLRYVQTDRLLCDNEYYKFEHKHALGAVKLWLATAPVMEEPKAVRFKDEPGLTMCRLPWSFDPGKVCPTFDEIFARMMTNAHAAMDYIGSLFEEESYRQQYLYIYGQGQDSKGALTRFLMRVFKDASQMLECPVDHQGRIQDKHWTSHLVGVRLGIFDDLDIYNFPASGFFKRLTGTDRVYVNPKNKTAHNAPLTTKFIMTSNRLPVIGSQQSDQRRAIIVEMQANDDFCFDPEYEAKLWAEGGAFLSNCIQNYRQTYPTHGMIKVETDIAEMIAEEREAPMVAIMEACFELDEQCGIDAQTFYSALSARGLSNYHIGEFKEWLKRKHGISLTQKRADGKKRMYHGLKCRAVSYSAGNGM